MFICLDKEFFFLYRFLGYMIYFVICFFVNKSIEIIFSMLLFNNNFINLCE